MAFGSRNRDKTRVGLEDIEEIQKEIEFEKKFVNNKPSLKGKKPVTINNCTFFINKDEDEAHTIKRLTKTFTNRIL